MVPLLVRSHYSFLWGTASPRALCQAARRLGYQALALTDRDNLCGLWAFLRACREEGLRPLVGAEVTDPAGQASAVCLAQSAEGFSNLCRLISRRHLEPAFDLARELPERAAGLSILTSSAELLRLWRGQGLAVAAALPMGLGSQSLALRQAARRLGAPLVAVPGSYFLEPGGHLSHRVLRAIGLNTSLSRLGPEDIAPPAAWLAGPEEYARRFSACPQALAASDELAEAVSFLPRPGVIMPPWHDPQGQGAAQVLRQEAYAGAARRYGAPWPAAVSMRLEHELALIEAKGFSSYFLVVQQIVGQSPRTCGRGSGAASLVAYCLGITNVCPLKFNLYFERFLNQERQDPPDIDVDFAWDERDELLRWVLQRHRGQAAMVGTHLAFQGRLAIREVAKVFGLPAQEIKIFMKELPWLRGPVEGHTGFYPKRQALPPGARPAFPEPWPQVLRLAQGLVGTPRLLSLHVGGVVITPGPIHDYAPVQRAAKGLPVIQWEKDGTEEAGLVKIDLLGNRSLAVIRDAIGQVRAGGQAFDEAAWQPEDDPATQGLVARGQTMGCFYIESPATRLLQQKANKGDYEHLVIHSSIIRPAANDYIQEYLRRLQGAPWQPLHPLLSETLAESYGIMVYQEHVSQAAMALAGFSHAQADRLRKAMSWKDKGRLLKDYGQQFAEGARARGVDQECIARVWDMMLSFSGYSFCKPHSASYARVSFQAAYLKAHFPAQFMAAVISNQGGFYSTFAYVSEARRLGLGILPPDVQRSQEAWSGQGHELRVGLMAVKGLGAQTRRRIVAQRASGPYADLEDFCRRAAPEQDEVQALLLAGALGELHPGENQAQLRWRLAQSRQQQQRQAQGGGGLFAAPAPPPPELPPERELERLRRQYQVLGFLTDRHPMVLFEQALPRRGVIKARDLAAHLERRVLLAGWLITAKTVWSKSEQAMQFVTFEDETGLVEATLFPKAYTRLRHVLDWGRPFLLRGRVEENFGAATLTLEEARPLAGRSAAGLATHN